MANYLVTFTTELPPTENGDAWPTMVENCIIDAEDAGDAAYILEDIYPDAYVVYVGELDQVEMLDTSDISEKKRVDKVVDGNIIHINFGRKDK